MIAAIARPLIAALVALGIGTTILFFTSGSLWEVVAVLAVASTYAVLMYLTARNDLLQTLRYIKHAIGRGWQLEKQLCAFPEKTVRLR